MQRLIDPTVVVVTVIIPPLLLQEFTKASYYHA
jgi:hypothetical protein